MAQRGRKPNPVTAPLNPEQCGAPIKPDTIKDDPIALRLWDYLCLTLSAQRTLSPTNGPILLALCSAYSRMIQIRDILKVESFVVRNDKTGATRAHPLLATEAGAAAEVAKYSAMLGLTPTSRHRIGHLESVNKEESLDDILS
jgi:P27 family predicted phage terminase small subunit